MRVFCPECSSPLAAEDLNPARDMAFCRRCVAIGSLNERLSAPSAQIDLPGPPPGAWRHETDRGVRFGGRTRSLWALLFVPFAVVWVGLVIGGIFGSQIAAGQFKPVESVLGLVFLVPGAGLVSLAAMLLAGKTEVRVEGGRIVVFNGVGAVGLRWRIDAAAVDTVRAAGPVPRYAGRASTGIALEGTRYLKFGTLLSDERRDFVISALRRALQAPSQLDVTAVGRAAPRGGRSAKIICGRCDAQPAAGDVNVVTGVALCRRCGVAFLLPDLSRSPSGIDVDDPPPGAWWRETIDGVRFGATTRSWVAWYVLFFVLVFGGISVGLYSRQWANQQFSLGLSLLAAPFLLAALLFGGLVAMTTAGKVEVRLEGGRGTVFVGVGLLGLRSRFDAADVVAVREGKPSLYYGDHAYPGITLQARRRTAFGRLLSEQRCYFVINALRRALDHDTSAGADAPASRGQPARAGDR